MQINIVHKKNVSKCIQQCKNKKIKSFFINGVGLATPTLIKAIIAFIERSPMLMDLHFSQQHACRSLSLTAITGSNQDYKFKTFTVSFSLHSNSLAQNQKTMTLRQIHQMMRRRMNRSSNLKLDQMDAPDLHERQRLLAQAPEI